MTSLICRLLKQGALGLIFLMGAVLAAAAGPADHPREVVDELAFSKRQFPEEGTIAVSANGAHLAFVVCTPPVDINRDGYYTAGGLPATVVGTRIYVRSLKNRDAARQICAPAGQQWFPAWSPDGRRLAFYSDAGGTPQLWLYDRTGDKCRPIATPKIRMTPFVASRPYWRADNRTVYVPLMPKFATPPLSENTRPGMTDGTPQVGIHRSGREIEKKEKEKIDKAGQRRNQTLQEHNVAFGAVDVDSGAHRIVVPADSSPRPMAMRLSASGRWLGYLSVFRRSADLASSKLEAALAVVPASGGKVIPLTDGLPNVQNIHDRNYSWHPQKDQLVYVKTGELWHVVLGPDGRVKKRRLDTDPDAISHRVHWFTRDGTAVVVQPLSIADEAPVLRVTPLDGSPSRPVILDRSRWQFQGLVRTDSSTLWQPDGRALIIRARNVRTAEQAILSLTPGKSPRASSGRAKAGSAI